TAAASTVSTAAEAPAPAPAPAALPDYAPKVEVVHVPDAQAAATQLTAWLRPGDVVLVKGPRAMGLERTAALLLGGAGQ
ncbi:MAG: UDP-N-acetylmuramoyl-tripeptide--D-alanyl-D-alanine ligase, partial [Thermoactinospora sp.]|nr:UDP-N-acetylmuramoyl-tripeptide--D-alanyl-D-alanine ligase [Thermoactinospora sp.]